MSSLSPAAHTAAALLLTMAALGGCAAAPPADAPVPDEPGIEGARGVPGFDTREYPGDAAMRTWYESSPYRWVGYYLEAPCHTGLSWRGTRSKLEEMGWGVAVLFVGEQDWSEILPEEEVRMDPDLPRCARPNLNAERGRTDAVAAADATAGEGFPRGTAVYLDVERVERVSSDLRDYVRGWAQGLLEDGRYVPALYAHSRNADELHGIYREEFDRAGHAAEPRLWVVRTSGFNLRRGPTESGFPNAHIWQGILDTRESWGGVTLDIDANVARSANPSR